MKYYIEVQNSPNCTSILHIALPTTWPSTEARDRYRMVYPVNKASVHGCEWYPFFTRVCDDGRRQSAVNACVTDLPHIYVPMCWFHVTKMFESTLKKRKSVFADLYDMHYAGEQEYPTVKEPVITKWRDFPRGSPARKLTDHIIKMWVNSHRFSRWQTFWTPSGYATTNNPLEQYHRKVKLQCPGGPQPAELLKI
ncbi:hypothetical protein GQ600_17712 [Phytophthora cactorum]|nr:hypothetical protein GQ600_17712 [Phytophthora cactorum]